MATTLFVAAAICLAGYLSWGLVEYGIHGVLSHRFKTFVSPMHWGHHRTPAAVFTSPIAWVPIAGAIFGAAWWSGGPSVAVPFTTGLLAGFARYEWLHWRIHFRTARTPREEVLRQHHLAHHFVNPRAYHGVTTRLWDRAFGTLPSMHAQDYARVATHPPIEGASNLALVWNPRTSARIVAANIRRSAEDRR